MLTRMVHRNVRVVVPQHECSEGCGRRLPRPGECINCKEELRREKEEAQAANDEKSAAEARTAQIMSRVKNENVRPDIDIVRDAHEEMEVARNMLVKSMKELLQSPAGKHLVGLLGELQTLLEIEERTRSKYLEATTRR